MECLFVCLHPSSYLPICQLKKPYLTNHNCEAFHSKFEAEFGPNGPLCFSNSIIIF